MITRTYTEKAAEQNSQDIHFALLQNSVVGIILRDVSGKIIYTNNAFAQMMQASETAELLGKSYLECVHPEDCAESTRRLAAASAGKVNPLRQHRLIGLQGRVIFVESTSVSTVKDEQPHFMGVFHDISERKLMEAALLRSVEIQTVLKEIAEAAILSSSLDDLYAKVHKSTGRIFPAKNFYIALLDEVAGQIVRPYCVDNMFPVPRNRPVGKGLTEYVMRQGRVFYANQSELTRLRKTGEVSPLEAPAHDYLGAPLIDRTGKSFGVVALVCEEKEQSFQTEDAEILATIAAQVSMAIERKQIEQEVFASEARLREVLDNSLDASYKYDFQTNSYEYLSSVFEQITGYTLETITAAPFEKFYDLIHPDDLDEVKRMTDEAMASLPGVSYRIDYRFKHEKGYYRWFHDKFSVLHNDSGQTQAIIGSLSDVTDQVQFEAALRASEKRYRELVQHANVIILTMNGQGQITFINEYALNFFGYTSGELIGRTLAETILPEFETTGHILHMLLEAIKDDPQRYQRNTHENITRQNRRVWVDWTYRSTIDSDTGEAGLVCVGIDVTATKRAEREMINQFERRKRQESLTDIISKRTTQPDMANLLQQMDWKIEPPFVLNLLAVPAEYLSASASGKDPLEQQAQIDDMIDSLHAAKVGVIWQMPAGVVVLRSLSDGHSYPDSTEKSKWATDEVMKAVSRYWRGTKITAGASHSTDAAPSLAELYEQAQAALQYGPVLMPGKQVYYWHELGYFQLIVKDLQSAQVRQFIKDHLGPILSETNAEKLAQELATLEALISGDSLQVIADRLHLHKHTIVFRKKKIEALLGVDLDELETRVNIAMAIRMRFLLS